MSVEHNHAHPTQHHLLEASNTSSMRVAFILLLVPILLITNLTPGTNARPLEKLPNPKGPQNYGTKLEEEATSMVANKLDKIKLGDEPEMVKGGRLVEAKDSGLPNPKGPQKYGNKLEEEASMVANKLENAKLGGRLEEAKALGLPFTPPIPDIPFLPPISIPQFQLPPISIPKFLPPLPYSVPLPPISFPLPLPFLTPPPA